MDWKTHRVLVTGRASFIGSHLTDVLVARGARVRIVDDLTSGRLENLQEPLRRHQIEFIRADLLKPGVAQRAVEAMDVVFHLAANHGGRGYLEMHQAACATNLALDGVLFKACQEAGVKKVVYASSGGASRGEGSR
jgi:nucleoside-diphosphate-sugar epimerase